MPIYAYSCKKCGAEEEHIQRFSDPPMKKCETCGGKLEKLVSAAAFHLKGGGWYKDGYASAKSGGDSGDSGSDSGGSDSGSSDSGSSDSGSSDSGSGTSDAGGSTSDTSSKSDKKKPASPKKKKAASK